MNTVPISWLVSILAVFIAAAVVGRPHLPIAARVLFGLGLGFIAVVTAFVGLRVEYGFGMLGRVQPHIAILIAPTLWLGFRSLASTSGRPTGKAFQTTATGLVLAELALLVPTAWSADVIVIGINIVYAILLIVMLRQPPDTFVQVAPNKFRLVRAALVFAILFITLTIAADATILVAMLSAGDAGIMHLLTGASGVFVGLVLLCALIGLPIVLGPQMHDVSRNPVTQTTLEEDRDLLRRLDQLMNEHQIYTDPDLTLARLGRRLHCPARSVSNAVNRINGENVSRYINGFRVRHAAMMLTTTDLPVTDIMLEAGFQSKSSFNTEFRRLTGQTPSDYRRQGTGDRNVHNRDLKRSDT